MKIAVQDANVLIDLIECGLFEQFFELGIETYSTSLVLLEIRNLEQRIKIDEVIRKRLLKISTITTQKYLVLSAQQSRGLSVADLSVLELAKNLDATLLTGDAALRRTAKERAVVVKGILWVLDQMVAQQVIANREAATRLRLLQVRNPRLPQDEIDKRIKLWGNGGV